MMQCKFLKVHKKIKSEHYYLLQWSHLAIFRLITNADVKICYFLINHVKVKCNKCICVSKSASV